VTSSGESRTWRPLTKGWQKPNPKSFGEKGKKKAVVERREPLGGTVREEKGCKKEKANENIDV